MNYQNAAGSKMKIEESGKSFKVIINFPASSSGRIPAEEKVIKCRAWSGVEKQIKKWRMEEVA